MTQYYRLLWNLQQKSTKNSWKQRVEKFGKVLTSFWPFALVTQLFTIFCTLQKLANILFPAEHKVEKDLKVTPLSIFFFLSALLYLLFKEGLWSSEQIHNSVQLANLKSTLQTLSLWPLCGCKVDKTWGFFFGATLLFNNVTWTLTSHSRRAALGGVGRQAGPSEHEEIFLQNIGKINQNNML